MTTQQLPESGRVQYTPGPRQGTGTGANPKLKMLDLPRRGDRLAMQWWMWGIVTYAALSVMLVGSLLGSSGSGSRLHALATLFGLGATPNYAVLALVTVGVVLTLFTAGRVLVDIKQMSKEEVDIEWVEKTGHGGLHLVFVDADKRAKLLGKQVDIPDENVRVETLMDDRVRRIHVAMASQDGGTVIPEDLRGIAEVRTAQYGGFARYVSSLLLLLAVLGTFAGVKTALPGLIESITATTTTSTDAGSQGAGDSSDSEAKSTAGLVRSLEAVAGAFGGNALALIGAIAIGLMAQGVGFGRRNLLERLELVSAEYLYGQNVASDSNPMQAAIGALRDTAREMHSASGSMLGIEDGLQALGRQFSDSFNTFADRMKDITARQEEGLYEKTGAALDSLQRRVNDLATVIEANANTYAGLAEAVRTRSQESKDALGSMSQANTQLAHALDGILAASRRSDESVAELRTAVGELKQGSVGMNQQLERMTDVVAQVAPSIDTLGQTLSLADERLRASETHSREQWEKVSTAVIARINDGVDRASAAEERAAKVTTREERTAVQRDGGADPEATRLLREISNELREQRGAGRGIGTLAATVLPLLGALVGGGSVYLLLRYFAA